MTYIEFADAVEKMMNKKMKGGVRASLYTAMKNNGKERTGILIEMPRDQYFSDNLSRRVLRKLCGG